MKQKIFILLVFIGMLSVKNTDAQTDSTSIKTKSAETDNYVPESKFRTVRLGIFGIIGASWMKPKTTDYKSEGSKLAYSYGLLIDYNFTENYTFSTGVSFNSLGGKLSYSDVATISGTTKAYGVMHRSYRINYLQIPTILKLKSNQMGYFTYYAQLGINHNFRLSSFADDSFEYDNPTKALTTSDQEMKDYTAFYRMSFTFGFGTEYAISQTLSAYASFNFDNGLTNSLSNKNSISGQKESAFIKKLSLTAGFLF